MYLFLALIAAASPATTALVAGPAQPPVLSIAQAQQTASQDGAGVVARPPSLALSIDDAVTRALQQNFRMQRSNRNEDIAEARVRGVRSNLRPRFDLSINANQNQSYYEFAGTALQFNRAEPQFYVDAYASASLPLDISGVTRRQVEQSEFSHDLITLDQRQAEIDVSTEVRTSYVAALRAQEQVNADQVYLDLLDELIGEARSRQPSVVPFLQTERANALQALASTSTSRDLAVSSLLQLLRLGREVTLVLTTVLPPPPPIPATENLLDLADQNRIDLKQADIRLRQARLAAIQAGDSRRPSLRLTAYGSQRLNAETPLFNDDQQGRTTSGGVIISATIPLAYYDGGFLQQQRRITEIQAEQAVADRQEGIERAANEINQVMISLMRARQRLGSLPDANQALVGLRRVEALLLDAPAGDAPSLVAQVTNARQNWRSAVVSRNDALTDFYASYYRLQRAVGSDGVELIS